MAKDVDQELMRRAIALGEKGDPSPNPHVGSVVADAQGNVLPPDDFDAQAKMVMENLTKALAAGGAKLADVTKVTIYICNPHDVPKARGILFDYFGKHPPGSTLCVLRGLANPNFLLEIEAIAAV